MGTGAQNASVPFENQPDLLLGCWMLATKTGHWPHEVLDLDVWEISFAMMCYQQADATSAQLLERLARSGSPVFPTVCIKSG